MLEKVLDRDDLNRAYKRVKANKGASGVDEMKNDMERWNEWLRRRIRMYIYYDISEAYKSLYHL